MSSGRIEQKRYEMLPRATGLTSHISITVVDIDRSADYLREGLPRPQSRQRRQQGASGHIQIANKLSVLARRKVTGVTDL